MQQVTVWVVWDLTVGDKITCQLIIADHVAVALTQWVSERPVIEAVVGWCIHYWHFQIHDQGIWIAWHWVEDAIFTYRHLDVEIIGCVHWDLRDQSWDDHRLLHRNLWLDQDLWLHNRLRHWWWEHRLWHEHGLWLSDDQLFLDDRHHDDFLPSSYHHVIGQDGGLRSVLKISARISGLLISIQSDSFPLRV